MLQKLISATLKDDGTLEVIRREPSLGGGYLSEQNTRALKEIYEARNGKIVLTCTVVGQYQPPRTEHIQEKITFPEEN